MVKAARSLLPDAAIAAAKGGEKGGKAGGKDAPKGKGKGADASKGKSPKGKGRMALRKVPGKVRPLKEGKAREKEAASKEVVQVRT